jgi:hypothetical protein
MKHIGKTGVKVCRAVGIIFFIVFVALLINLFLLPERLKEQPKSQTLVIHVVSKTLDTTTLHIEKSLGYKWESDSISIPSKVYTVIERRYHDTGSNYVGVYVMVSKNGIYYGKELSEQIRFDRDTTRMEVEIRPFALKEEKVTEFFVDLQFEYNKKVTGDHYHGNVSIYSSPKSIHINYWETPYQMSIAQNYENGKYTGTRIFVSGTNKDVETMFSALKKFVRGHPTKGMSQGLKLIEKELKKRLLM